MDDKARIQLILQANMHMVLSTADKNGKPWVTPVAYASDKGGSLYWVSSKDSLHSSNIRVRPEVAIVIYMTEPRTDAVYIEARAEELTNSKEIKDAIALRNNRPQPDKWRVKTEDDVLGKSSWRIYKATGVALYFREESQIGNQTVTVRRKIY